MHRRRRGGLPVWTWRSRVSSWSRLSQDREEAARDRCRLADFSGARPRLAPGGVPGLLRGPRGPRRCLTMTVSCVGQGPLDGATARARRHGLPRRLDHHPASIRRAAAGSGGSRVRRAPGTRRCAAVRVRACPAGWGDQGPPQAVSLVWGRRDERDRHPCHRHPGGPGWARQRSAPTKRSDGSPVACGDPERGAAARPLPADFDSSDARRTGD